MLDNWFMVYTTNISLTPPSLSPFSSLSLPFSLEIIDLVRASQIGKLIEN
jgi:hypothetical protein